MTTVPAQSKPSIHFGEDSLAALEAIELNPDIFQKALQQGLSAASQTTDFHPKTAKGIYLWSEVNASVRKQAVETNSWFHSDPKNRPVVTHTQRGLEITCVAGTAATGNKDAQPDVKHRRGPETAKAAANQLVLFSEVALRSTPSRSVEISKLRGTWFYLYHVHHDGHVSHELSYPSAWEEGRVTAWELRILLPDLEPSNVTMKVIPTDDDDSIVFNIQAM